MDNQLRNLERQYHADPNNLHLAQHLIAAYQRMGLRESQEKELPYSCTRKNKWETVDGVEISEDTVDDWVADLLSHLQNDGWAKFPDSDSAEHRVTFSMSGDTLVQASAWRYIGTDTWYVSFDVTKRTKRYYGQRTFKPETQKELVTNE